MRPQAKLLFGLLQAAPAQGEYAYKALGASTRLSLPTVRACIRELTGTGWMDVSQAGQRSPIHITLQMPQHDALEQAMRRLEDREYSYEAIMQEYLSLLIDADEFEENARPGFLINPLTGERMELDRYYPPSVAFEYNGAQHYRTTDWFPSEPALARRMARDLMKEALCARRGIRFIVIHRADLNLKSMQEKVGTFLPLRDLSGCEPLIQFLEKVSK